MKSDLIVLERRELTVSKFQLTAEVVKGTGTCFGPFTGSPYVRVVADMIPMLVINSQDRPYGLGVYGSSFSFGSTTVDFEELPESLIINGKPWAFPLQSSGITYEFRDGMFVGLVV